MSFNLVYGLDEVEYVHCQSSLWCENVGRNDPCQLERKIDLTERPIRDDRPLGNGFKYPDFSA